jgi:hypothetical protein
MVLAKGPPRFDLSIGDDLDKYWASIPEARSNRLVYLVGMSQMYKINDFRDGDLTIAEHLDDMLAPKARVFGIAAPNLDNEEALLLLVSVLTDPNTTPSAFIYAVCFDKMRFLDVRPGYMNYVRHHPEVEKALLAVADRYAARYPLASTKIRRTLGDIEKPAAGDDKSFEHRAREGVGRLVPLVGQRQDLNVLLTYGLLYEARNKLLGISNTTKRPIISGRYDLNKEFLRIMIDISKERGVQFLYYINPLNPQADNPYVPAQYDVFKQWAESNAVASGVPFANLENVVPKDAWGLFMGGPDFKHFSGRGHLLTAKAIADRFGQVIAGPRTVVRRP